LIIQDVLRRCLEFRQLIPASKTSAMKPIELRRSTMPSRTEASSSIIDITGFIGDWLKSHDGG
jgi:hypothetical protein